MMEYKTIKNTVYIRIDKGEDIVQTILSVCKKENILGGYFQGIGACSTATISTYIPEQNDFIDHTISGMIEMISLMGNISTDDMDNPFQHSHAMFSYLKTDGEIAIAAGHLKEAQIGYTGEIVLTPAEEKIGRVFDPLAGIDVWKLS